MQNINYIELFILNTITYFDLFDYPLTLNEIYQYLYTGGMQGGNFNLLDIEDCLKKSEYLQKIITAKNGFYFLKNRQSIVKTRLERYNLTNQKYKIALKAVRIFKYLPFIKLVAVCNSLGMNNATEESDIDLFIITEANRIWLARLLLVAVIFILGLRPPKEKAKDKICLSYYITTEHLDLADTRILADDIYLIYWLATLTKLYERDSYLSKFYQANSWLKKYLPNWQAVVPGYRRRVEENFFSRMICRLGEFLAQKEYGDYFNYLAKRFQLKRLSQEKKDVAVRHKNWVIIRDDILKFHITDRREYFLNLFEQKINAVLGKN
jgi:predicted nucleotidyltransferase